MNTLELFNFLKELLQKDAEVIASFLVGVVITVVGLWFLRRWFLVPKQLTDVRVRGTSARNQVDIERGTVNTLKQWLEKDTTGRRT